MNHIDEARSKLNPCVCGCTFISIITWQMDNGLKLGEMYAVCGYCHKRTRTHVNPFDAQRDWNDNRVFDKHIEIAHERKIVENCISIISSYINEYNDTMQLEGDDKVPLPKTPIWVLVKDLLLQGTTHAGKTTSIQKAKELGFVWDENAFETGGEE